MPGGKQGLISWLLRALGLKRGGPRDDLLSSSRFHRIIRRGRPYGAVIDHRESVLRGKPPGVASGIYFISLNANISRQFEFIQDAWIVNAKFNGLDGETDPLLGNRVPSLGNHVTDRLACRSCLGWGQRIAGLRNSSPFAGAPISFCRASRLALLRPAKRDRLRRKGRGEGALAAGLDGGENARNIRAGQPSLRGRDQ
jgi:hypothetical protein